MLTLNSPGLLFSMTIKGEKSTVKILMENKSSKQEYFNDLKNFILSTSDDSNDARVDENIIITDVDIEFTNLNETFYKKDNKPLITEIVNHLKNVDYDIMALDDQFLFNDISNIASSYVENTFSTKKIHDYYLDLTNEISKDVLAFHHPEALNGGYFDGKLYALPYEVDYTVLYSTNNNSTANYTTWDDLLSLKPQLGHQRILTLPLGDNDELLNTLIEYTSNKYDISNKKGGNNDNFEIFYNEKSKELYSSFSNFLGKVSIPSTLNDTLEFTQDKAYNSFLNNESLLYRGKISQLKTIKDGSKNQTISLILPPGNKSMMYRQYLVINKNSKVNKDKLIQIAKKLTSKKLQLFRSLQFGNIPTFDFSKRENDYTIDLYCKTNEDLCNLTKNIDSIQVKDVFNNPPNGAPYMEARLLLPEMIKSYLNTNNDEIVVQGFDNTKNLVMNTSLAKKYNYLLIVMFALMAIFVIGAFVIIYLLHKYKNHPNIEIYSPGYCSIIIIGFVLGIVSPLFLYFTNTIWECEVFYIYNIIYTNLIILPMVAIVLRNYYHHSNKRLITFIILWLLLMIGVGIGVLFLSKTYILSIGSISNYRFPSCGIDGNIIYSIIDSILNVLMFLFMTLIILRSTRIAKEYSEYRFIYILIFIFIFETATSLIIKYVINLSFVYYILLCIVYMICYVLCIHILIGSKLIFTIKTSKELK